MNNGYKQSHLQEHEDMMNPHVYETISEEIIYCDEEFEGDPGINIQEEDQPDVPCYVMDNVILTQENIDAANQDHSVCYFCKEDLKNKRFYVHLFDRHGFNKPLIEVMKQQKRLENHKSNPKMKSLHSCAHCGMEFITKTGMNNHLKKDKTPCALMLAHREDPLPTASNIVCPSYGCTAQFGTYLELAVHVDSYHRDLVTSSECFMIRRKTFQDKASFMTWKKEMEEKTTSEFFLRTSQKVAFAVRTTLYKCLCSNSRGQPNRKSEQCPAFIKCCQRKHGQFEVVACFGHLGHEHPTETDAAVEYRKMATREKNRYHYRIPNQTLRPTPQEEEDHQFESATHHANGMMILMPGSAEEEDSFPQAVDDADDDIVGPRDQIILQEELSVSEEQVVYTTYPGSSHY